MEADMSCSVVSIARGAAAYAKASFDLSLYLVADRGSVGSDKEFFHKIGQAITGGVSCIQYRDLKTDTHIVLETAKRLQQLLRGTSIRLFVNGPIEVAERAYADGVFLEQKTMSYNEVRKRLGESAIIGMPVSTREEARFCNDLDLDYVSVKVFRSQRTNPHDHATWGMAGLREIRPIILHRVVAIGGIDKSNSAEVVRSLKSDDGIAMVGDLWRKENTLSTAKKIRAIVDLVRKSQGDVYVS